MKILVIPGHLSERGTTGVDYVRLILPMEHLGKEEGFDVDIMTLEEGQKMTIQKWWEAAKKYDIFYSNYNSNDKGFAAMACMIKKEGKKLVMDLDDSLWHIREDNSSYQTFKKGSRVLHIVTVMLNESDRVTCTNSYLRNIICHNTNLPHDKIEVFPNCIDLDLYSYRSKAKEKHKVTITHFGSSSHFMDLQEGIFEKALIRIMNEYPNVVLKTVGAFLPKYKDRWGVRYEHGYGSPDLYTWVKEKYPDFMKEADLLVSPLSNDIYNKCKSSVKYLETSASKVPGVYQDIRQYQNVIDHGVNGYLAGTEDEWYESIKELVDSKDKREEVGNNAFHTVEKFWQMKNNLDGYKKFFKELMLDNPIEVVLE